MSSSREGIAFLEERLAELPASSQEVFRRIFHVSTATGTLMPPASMRRWIEERFGSLDAVKRQRIVKMTNLVTMEGALFNALRARRPMEALSGIDVGKAILESVGDPFCHPLEKTPEDIFGRIRGAHAITGSNVAKYDGFHGLVMFDEHDPLNFTAEQVASYLDTALEWAREANRWDPRAKYFFFMWNCLWKSGASIIHGHAQMALSHDLHYAKVEGWRKAACAYRERYGTNYFHDLVQAHASLDLAWPWSSTRCMAYLTPIRDNEVLLVSEAIDGDLKRSIHRVLRCFIEEIGVRSFNLALYMPPLAPTTEDWDGFPVIVRIVDRGNPANRTADVGAMELYASSIIASDPFIVARTMQAFPNPEIG